jgi:hypothetical protein
MKIPARVKTKRMSVAIRLSKHRVDTDGAESVSFNPKSAIINLK